MAFFRFFIFKRMSSHTLYMKSWIPNNVKLILTDNPVKVAEIKKSENTYIAFLSGKSTNLDMGCNIFSESCDKYLPT